MSHLPHMGPLNRIKRKSTIHFTAAHERVISEHIKCNQTGLEYSNHLGLDPLKPSIHQIVSFVIPRDALPSFPRTFGDIGEFFSSFNLDETKTSGHAFLATDQGSISKANAWSLFCLMSVLTCDPTAGSPPHREQCKKKEEEVSNMTNAMERIRKEWDEDIKAAEEQRKEVENIKKSLKNGNENEKEEKEGKETDDEEDNDKKANTAEDEEDKDEDKSEKEEDDDDDDSSKEDQEQEKEKEENEEDENEEEDNEESDEKTSKHKNKKKGKKDKTKKDTTTQKDDSKKTNVPSKATITPSAKSSIQQKAQVSIEDKRHESKIREIEFDKKHRDIRGMAMDPNLLEFTFNSKRYPKVVLYVEELEGHSDMPESESRVTIDSKLTHNNDENAYCVSNNKSNLLGDDDNNDSPHDPQQENLGNEIRTGNGSLVGYRFWYMVLDPNFNYASRLSNLLRENRHGAYNKLITNPKLKYIPHPHPNYVRSVSSLKNEYHLAHQLYIPYFTLGMAYAEKGKDNFYRSVFSSVGGNKRLEKTKINQILSHKSTFLYHMNLVCDSQRNPSSYFDMNGGSSNNNNTSPSQETATDSTTSSKKKSGGKIYFTTDKQRNAKRVDDNEDVNNNMQIVVQGTSALSSEELDDPASTFDPLRKKTSEKEPENEEIEESEESSVENQKNNSSPIDSYEEENRLYNQERLDSSSCLIGSSSIFHKKIYGFDDPKEFENFTNTVSKSIENVNPNQFKGFSRPERVWKVGIEYAGCTMLNLPFPHILRETKYSNISKVVKSYSKTKDYEASIGSIFGDENDQLNTATKAGEEGEPEERDNIDQFFKDNTDIQITERINMVSISEDEELLKKGEWGNSSIHNDKTQKSLRVAANLNSFRDSRSEDEASQILTNTEVSFSIKTPTDVKFMTSGHAMPYLPEMHGTTMLTLAELELYASRHDLLSLRIKCAEDVASLKNKFPDLGEEFSVAMKEIAKIRLNDFANIFMYSNNLPLPIIHARNWYRDQVCKKKHFSSIALSYADLTKFGNGIQWLRGLWSEVFLGRNHFDLFLLFWTVYGSSFYYSFDLKANLLVSGEGGSSKSFNLKIIQNLTVPGTLRTITHATGMHYMQEEDLFSMLHAYHEAPSTFSGETNKRKRQDNASVQHDAIMKDALDRCRASIRTFQFLRNEDGTTARRTGETEVVLQQTIIALQNLISKDPDDPWMQRFLLLVHAKMDGSDIFESDKKTEASRFMKEEEQKNIIGGRSANDTTDENGKQKSNSSDVYEKVYTNQQDLATTTISSTDYKNDEDDDLKHTAHLIHFYMLFVDSMITAGVLPNISTDLSDRLLKKILDCYTGLKRVNKVQSRKITQFGCLVRALSLFDSVITTLFTDYLHLDLKKEKVEIITPHEDAANSTSSTSTSSSTTTPTEKRSTKIKTREKLDVHQFANVISKYLYVKTEHVALTCSMVEPFVGIPRQSSIYTAALDAAGWPYEMQISNFMTVTKSITSDMSYISLDPNEETYLNSGFGKGRKKKIMDHIFVDARYICIGLDESLENIYRKIKCHMAEQISLVDIIRVFAHQSKQFVSAKACMILSRRDWDDIKQLTDFSRSVVREFTNKTQLPAEELSNADSYARGVSGDDSNSTQVYRLKSNQNVSTSTSTSTSSSENKDSSDSDSNMQTDSPQKAALSSKTNSKKTDVVVGSTTTTAKKRNFVVNKIDGREVPLPSKIKDMKDWFHTLYKSFDELLADLETKEGCDKSGIDRCIIMADRNAVWIRFTEDTIEPKRVTLVRQDHDEINRQIRVSILIENAIEISNQSMKTAIISVLSTKSIPKEGVRYMDSKPYIGYNEFTKRKESSSYINGVHEIPHNPNVSMIFQPAIFGQSSSRNYLLPNNSIKEEEEEENNENEDYSDKEQEKKPPTPYQINKKISAKIREQKPLDLGDQLLDTFGQIRHFYRIGLDPKRLVSIKTNNGIKDIEEYKITCSYFQDKMLQCALRKKFEKSKKKGKNANICLNFPLDLWREEYTANYYRKLSDQTKLQGISEVFYDFCRNNNSKPMEETEMTVDSTNGNNKHGVALRQDLDDNLFDMVAGDKDREIMSKSYNKTTTTIIPTLPTIDFSSLLPFSTSRIGLVRGLIRENIKEGTLSPAEAISRDVETRFARQQKKEEEEEEANDEANSEDENEEGEGESDEADDNNKEEEEDGEEEEDDNKSKSENEEEQEDDEDVDQTPAKKQRSGRYSPPPMSSNKKKRSRQIRDEEDDDQTNYVAPEDDGGDDEDEEVPLNHKKKTRGTKRQKIQ